MPAKVQSHGINKNTLIKLHQDLLEDILSRGYEISDQKMADFTEFSRLHSAVILFGVDELATSDFRFKTCVLEGFDPSYGGLNTFVEKESHTRSYEDFSEWVLEKLKFAENFFIRSLVDVPSDETEEEYLLILLLLENFLAEQFSKVLLPELEKLETEVREYLGKLYNNTDLTEQEVIDEATQFLDEKEKEAVALFSAKIQEDLNNESIKQALVALGILGLANLSDSIIETQTKKAKFGYISNIGAFFYNEMRQVKEIVFDNIMSGKRSLVTDQLANLKFNRNIFKLSVLAHPRALFRSIIAIASDVEYFKAIVPPSVLPTLNPSGVTANNLYLIKTKDEWSKTNGVENINVVDGLGLHHGSIEYYKPIFDLQKENTLAKEQRRIFLQSLN